MSYYTKYYPQPTFTHINEEGEITLEWCAANDDRILIVFDNSGNLGELESNVYAIHTAAMANGKVVQGIFPIKGTEDVIRAMKLIGLEAAE